MSVPANLVGAWRRSGLFLEGARVVDHADVLWLQTPEWFADMRVRLDPRSRPASQPEWLSAEFAFAGPAEWEPPVMTWHHHFDAYFGSAKDANPLTPVDGVMREDGVTQLNGRDVSFAEEWLRMTEDDVAWSADVERDRVRVEVGRFAIEIADSRDRGGAFTATRMERVGQNWNMVRALTIR